MTSAPLRILVVDDNVDATRMMTLLLKLEGFDAKAAFDGPEAIKAATVFKPDAVLLDLKLPGMSGLEIATELKGIPELCGCVLVAVSGCDTESIEAPSPFEHHFQKPVNHQALLKLLAAIRPSHA